MKTFKAISAAFVLALSLSIPAYADTTPGDGHTPGAPAPPIVIPTTAPENTESSDGAPTIGGDIRSLSISDILWLWASIY